MTPNNPHITIVMPTYDRAAVIKRAVDSVLQQTYADWELIVVDDGSTDNTEQIFSEINDSRIHYIRHKINRGCAAARNTALEMVRGELISFLDSDDTWELEKLETDVNFLNHHEEVQAVFCDLMKIDGDIRITSFMRETSTFSQFLAHNSYPEGIVLGKEQMYHYLLQEAVVKTPAVTVRTHAMKATGRFNESLVSGEDWEFFMRFARANRFAFIDRPLVIVECRTDSTHRRHFIEDKEGMRKVLRNEQATLVDDSLGLLAVRRGIVNLWKHQAWSHQTRGEHFLAARCLFQGFVETRNLGLLFRSIALLIPTNLRVSLRRLLKVFRS